MYLLLLYEGETVFVLFSSYTTKTANESMVCSRESGNVLLVLFGGESPRTRFCGAVPLPDCRCDLFTAVKKCEMKKGSAAQATGRRGAAAKAAGAEAGKKTKSVL